MRKDQVVPGATLLLEPLPAHPGKLYVGAPVWRVIGLIDQPAVTVENIITGARETHVLESRNFKERFVLLKPEPIE